MRDETGERTAAKQTDCGDHSQDVFDDESDETARRELEEHGEIGMKGTGPN
jgi:hypothetical protein